MIRHWIDLMEDVTEPGIPSTLYHGTSIEAWEAIVEDNAFRAGGEHRERLGVSFTENFMVARRFALHGRDAGVVITIDAEKLAERYRLERFEDSGTFHPEDEWVVWDVHSIPDFLSYVLDVEEVGL